MIAAEYDSPVGKLLLTCEDDALTGLWMENAFPIGAEPGEEPEVIARAKRWLDAYFRGMPREVDFSLAPKGTRFQQQVWEILLTIPHGKTMSYGQIARRLGEHMSAQAVGGAVGRNPISIIIPCHRVIGARKQLTGYAGGLERKRWLLDHEGIEYRE